MTVSTIKKVTNILYHFDKKYISLRYEIVCHTEAAKET
jgi:hypothetical protein